MISKSLRFYRRHKERINRARRLSRLEKRSNVLSPKWRSRLKGRQWYDRNRARILAMRQLSYQNRQQAKVNATVHDFDSTDPSPSDVNPFDRPDFDYREWRESWGF